MKTQKIDINAVDAKGKPEKLPEPIQEPCIVVIHSPDPPPPPPPGNGAPSQ